MRSLYGLVDARLRLPFVDPFVLAMLGFLLAMILGIVLLGKFYPGSGLDQLGMRSAREITVKKRFGWTR